MVCRCRAASTVPYSPVPPKEPESPTCTVEPSPTDESETFVVSKLVMLRCMGAIYLLAFLAAYFQNRALIGSAGLSPAHQHLERIQANTPLDSFLAHPAIWWFWPLTDDRLDAVALLGVALSTLVCIGLCSSLVMGALWLLYFSIVTAAEVRHWPSPSLALLPTYNPPTCERYPSHV